MQGQAFLGPNMPPQRQYVYGARDRMDERYDIIRTVRDKRYRYIRNYEPFKPYHQYMNTAEQGQITQELHRVAKDGQLPPEAGWFVADSKPVEELYDCESDLHEVSNLATDPHYRPILERLRKVHEQWMLETRDLGLIPEPELVELEEKYGTRYAILSQLSKVDPSFQEQLRSVAILAGRPGLSDLPDLVQALNSQHASIRYWAVTGIGNLGKEGMPAMAPVQYALKDPSPTVRVAAARTLFQIEHEGNTALPLLIAELKSSREWIRLHAALALASIGDRARSAVPALKDALRDTDNKYVVRVANHALNELLGTQNEVR
jgi:HEAT repeat protein